MRIIILLLYLTGNFYQPLVYILHDIHHLLTNTQHLHQQDNSSQRQYPHHSGTRKHSDADSHDHIHLNEMHQSTVPEPIKDHGHTHTGMVDLSLKSIKSRQPHSHSDEILPSSQISEHIQSYLSSLFKLFFHPRQYSSDITKNKDQINQRPSTPPPRLFS
jgi:hypothetical protein